MQKYLNRSILHTLIVAGIVMLLSTALVACGSNPTGLAIGDEAPDFTLTNANGQSVSLSDYIGRQKPVLLYFHMAVG